MPEAEGSRKLKGGRQKNAGKLFIAMKKFFRLLLACLFSNFFHVCVCVWKGGVCTVCVCVLSVLSFELIEKVNHRSFATR